MKRLLLSLMVIPALMVVVATMFLTLLAVGKADHLVWVYAVTMVVLTLINLWNEHNAK